MRNRILKISQDYFHYMSKHFPTMCISDEFYFFPRTVEAVRYIDRVEVFDEKNINRHINYIKDLISDLARVDIHKCKLDDRIDIILLKQSMSGFLIVFEKTKIWKTDPTLYLKIILLGIEVILLKLSFTKADKSVRMLFEKRLAQTKGLIGNAFQNLDKIPEHYIVSAIEIIENTTEYLKSSRIFLKDTNADSIISTLHNFRSFLLDRSTESERLNYEKQRGILREILKKTYSCNRSLEEIYDMACREYEEAMEMLEREAQTVDKKTTWRKILSRYRTVVNKKEDLLKLYSRETRRIKNFLEKRKILTIPYFRKVIIRFIPEFMRPLRSSASYSCCVTSNKKEKAYFYIIHNLISPKGKYASSLHNEYIFVTAHETYPGHHLLDSIRRALKNPIRRQIESPLFYEGWASYAEGLISEFGYVDEPVMKMLGLRRRAWRAVRAMLDVGLWIGKTDVSRIERILNNLGYDMEIAKSMVKSYILSLGYQLCYTVGKYEFERLKKIYASRIGIRRFHDFILQCGQIPFEFLEQKIRRI